LNVDGQWRGEAMVVILLSYFSTMVTVLAALMFFLNSVLGSSAFHQTRVQSYPTFAFNETSAPEREAAVAHKPQQVVQTQVDHASPTVAHLALAVSVPVRAHARRQAIQLASAAQQPAAMQQAFAQQQDGFTQKTKPVRIARDQRRQERVAARRQDQDHTVALGYAPAPQSRVQLAATRIFGTIGQPRGF
jgi:hypothetical protein